MKGNRRVSKITSRDPGLTCFCCSNVCCHLFDPVDFIIVKRSLLTCAGWGLIRYPVAAHAWRHSDISCCCLATCWQVSRCWHFYVWVFDRAIRIRDSRDYGFNLFQLIFSYYQEHLEFNGIVAIEKISQEKGFFSVSSSLKLKWVFFFSKAPLTL